MSKYKYSVIIPHKSSKDTLNRALVSIPNRTDIEIVIVDNSDIKLVKSDIDENRKNLKIFYSDPKLGAGEARNVGIQNCSGKWLLFLDADDLFIDESFCFFDEYAYSNFDVIFWNIVSKDSVTLELSNRDYFIRNLYNNYYLSNNENIFRYEYRAPWGKMINRSVVVNNNIIFESIPAGNDIMFSAKLGYHAKSIKIDNRVVYCLTNHMGSIVNTINKTNNRSRYCAYLRFNQFVSEINKPQHQVRLQSMIIKSFRFGIRETLWYLRKSKEYEYDVFFGFKSLIISFITRTKN